MTFIFEQEEKGKVVEEEEEEEKLLVPGSPPSPRLATLDLFDIKCFAERSGRTQ